MLTWKLLLREDYTFLLFSVFVSIIWDNILGCYSKFFWYVSLFFGIKSSEMGSFWGIKMSELLVSCFDDDSLMFGRKILLADSQHLWFSKPFGFTLIKDYRGFWFSTSFRWFKNECLLLFFVKISESLLWENIAKFLTFP